LAGGVAHDFNNTLQIILGHAEAILDQPTQNNFIRDSVQEIQRAALRSAGLTRQLLAFARQQTVSPRVCDLNEIVVSSITMLRSLIGEDIELIWQPAREPARVRIDPSQIDQILANLTINARDAINGHGRLVIALSHREVDEARAQTFTEAAPGLYVVLNVEDNGSGMSTEVLGRIFDPFFTTKEEGRGTGLGLSTVYGIVKQNGGFISVNSAPGKGTTFQIFLPLAGRGEEAEETPLPASAPIGTGTILVVEDERAIAFAVCKFLEMAGYRALTASNPADALQLAQEHAGEIDLLLADVVMPGMSGRDLALEMVSLYPEMKCLFMSGYTSDIIAHKGIIDQSLAFLPKPFTQAELLEKVRETMARV
jgi:CheY-like chemotaxis protein